MINWEAIAATSGAVGTLLLTALIIYAVLILLTRLFGVRSFSTLSPLDLSITFAIGAVLASTVLSKNPPLLRGIVALVALFALQFLGSVLRQQSSQANNLLENRPLLLMAGKEILHDNMQTAYMTKDDLYAKLREANVVSFEQIRAVVMESTGTVSVLQVRPGDPEPDLELLGNVRGIERLEQQFDRQ